MRPREAARRDDWRILRWLTPKVCREETASMRAWTTGDVAALRAIAAAPPLSNVRH